MATDNHKKSHLLLLIIQLLLLHRTCAESLTYKLVLKNRSLTLPGTYTSYNGYTKIRCAMICNQFGFDGLAHVAATNECGLYLTLPTFIEPITASEATLRTYLPAHSPIIFIKPVYGTRPWNNAKVECENLNGHMIPYPTRAESDRLFSKYGSFLVGLYKTSQQSTTFYDFFGGTVEQSQVEWDVGQPNNNVVGGNYEFCITRLEKGYHDLWCVTNENLGITLCVVYGDWKSS